MRRFLFAVLLLAASGPLVASFLEAEPPTNRLLTQPKIPTDQALSKLGLKRQWFTNVGTAGLRDGLASAQAFDGQVVTQTIGGCFTALDGETGAKQWQLRPGLAFQPHQRPVGANKHYCFLYAGTKLFGVDRKNGLVEWSIDLPLPLETAPSADEVHMYLVTSDHKVRAFYLPLTRQLRSETDQAAFDAMLSRRGLEPEKYGSASPKEIWSFDMGFGVAEPPAAFGSHILLGESRGTVCCFENGRRYMSDSFKAGGGIVAPIGQDGDLAFIASNDHHVYAVELIAGRMEPRWQFTAGSRIVQKPMTLGNDVFVCGDTDGLHRVDKATGKVAWTQPRARTFLAASPRLVIAADANKQLLALDRQRGAVLGSWDASGYAFLLPNDRSDRAYLANHNGLVLCLRDADPSCAQPTRYDLKLSTAMTTAANEFQKTKQAVAKQKAEEKAKEVAPKGEGDQEGTADGKKADDKKGEEKMDDKKEGKKDEMKEDK